MMTLVANAKTNMKIIMCAFVALLSINGCYSTSNPISYGAEKSIKEKEIRINSKCDYKTFYDDTIPSYVDYVTYEGKLIKFKPNSSFFQSSIISCLNTNQGLLILAQSKTYPAVSVSQSLIQTYRYDEKKNIFLLKKHLNKSWSCIPDLEQENPFNISSFTISMICKDKPNSDNNINPSFSKKYKVSIL